MVTSRVLIGGEWRTSAHPEGTFRARNPETGEALAHEYPVSGWAELDAMVRAGVHAAEALADTPVARTARFFELFAAGIEQRAQELATIAHVETGLPVSPRFLDVEIPRTTRQLRMAADVVRDDGWRLRVVDEAAHLRSEYRALGAPVLVIGPGNFPFAFGAVSGGDLAAALAAGNPVIGKAHPGHPETTRALAEIASESVRAAGLPPATVQMFYHCASETGLRLAAHPGIGAVAFTGSRPSGLALKAAADAAGVPFYAEMSAANPVILLPGALAARGPEIAHELFASFTLGCGQFCTKPGLVLLVDDEAGRRFLAELMALVENSTSHLMSSFSGRDRFLEATAAMLEAGARRLSSGRVTRHAGASVEPTVLGADEEAFLRAPQALQSEAFGPMTLVVTCGDEGALGAAVRAIHGSLAGSFYLAPGSADEAIYKRLARPVLGRVGRLLVNRMPTGILVSPAMHHGGPFPAASHPGFTSIGMPRSLLRFAALKCFDGVDEAHLP